ncbi:MAG: 7-carboxy-7-deazaguanine synthase [Gemmatimonadaceae bacterium]|jgi:7-carboxy-7-deazaguanine synthase (Cx14CxxC type)|nr:7-carboxy-7-deazaguanine synthase [Gemmatimonadaceae bacterium]
MTYTIKEIFYTLQGEGAQSGRAAVFCRFSGCNLWSGREEDRSRAVCQFCDTDFVGTGPDGGRFSSARELADAIDRCWGGVFPSEARASRKYVVCTGGEPLLQLDEDLIEALHRLDFEVAVETNGTRPAPASLDWICVSPKAGAPFVQTSGSELKLVYPQDKAPPETFARLDFKHFYLQPMDGPDLATNTERAIDYCLRNPRWRLSIQTHKLVGIR